MPNTNNINRINDRVNQCLFSWNTILNTKILQRKSRLTPKMHIYMCSSIISEWKEQRYNIGWNGRKMWKQSLKLVGKCYLLSFSFSFPSIFPHLFENRIQLDASMSVTRYYSILFKKLCCTVIYKRCLLHHVLQTNENQLYFLKDKIWKSGLGMRIIYLLYTIIPQKTHPMIQGNKDTNHITDTIIYE